MPFIVLGGIYSGAFSPTEAGVVSCVYGIIVGKFVYKELKWNKIIPMFKAKIDFLGGMSPRRASSCDEYKAWLKSEYDIDWDAGGREVPDLTEPQDKNAEVRA